MLLLKRLASRRVKNLAWSFGSFDSRDLWFIQMARNRLGLMLIGSISMLKLMEMIIVLL